MQKENLSRSNNERGSTMLEYALLVSLMALACISSFTSVGRNSARSFELVRQQMQLAHAGGGDGTGGTHPDDGVIFIPTGGGD